MTTRKLSAYQYWCTSLPFLQSRAKLNNESNKIRFYGFLLSGERRNEWFIKIRRHERPQFKVVNGADCLALVPVTRHNLPHYDRSVGHNPSCTDKFPDPWVWSNDCCLEQWCGQDFRLWGRYFRRTIPLNSIKHGKTRQRPDIETRHVTWITMDNSVTVDKFPDLRPWTNKCLKQRYERVFRLCE